MAAGGRTNRLEAGGPAAGGLTADRATARLAAAGPTAGVADSRWSHRQVWSRWSYSRVCSLV